MKHSSGQRRGSFPRLEGGDAPRTIADLETPAPVVDLDILTHNLDAMASYSALHGLELRPHVKTHKSPRIAADQVRMGAVGLTCATPREMEVMSDVSRDLLLAYPPIGAAKLARLMTLPRDVRLTVAVDSATAIVLRTLEREGLAPNVVSGGSTPSAWRMHEIPGLTEVRPGTYVYNDRTTAALGACSWDDCALTVLATVVSTAVPGQAVIDAGSKSLGREPMRGTEGEGFGALLDRPDVVVARLSEEHGILDISKTDWRPVVGDQVRVVPNHVCVVVHLNDEIHGVRGDVVETSWPVSARGREPLRTS